MDLQGEREREEEGEGMKTSKFTMGGGNIRSNQRFSCTTSDHFNMFTCKFLHRPSLSAKNKRAKTSYISLSLSISLSTPAV